MTNAAAMAEGRYDGWAGVIWVNPDRHIGITPELLAHELAHIAGIDDEAAANDPAERWHATTLARSTDCAGPDTQDPAMLRMNRDGCLHGTDDGLLDPWSPVTRYQLAQILDRC